MIRRPIFFAAAALLAVAATLAQSASARDSFNISLALPGLSIGYANHGYPVYGSYIAPPVTYVSPPVVYSPPAVAYAPAPVYYDYPAVSYIAPPVYVRPAPIYYYSRGWGSRGRGWDSHWGHDRHDYRR